MIKTTLLWFIVLLTSLKVYSQPTLIHTFEYSGIVKDLLFFPKGEDLIIAGYPSVKHFSIESFNLIHEFNVGTESIDFNSYYSLLATGTEPGITHLWNFETGELIHTFEGHDKSRGPRDPFVGVVQWLDISNNDKYLATGANDGKTILWNLDSKEEINRIFENGFLVFTPDDSMIFVKDVFLSIPSMLTEYEVESSGANFIPVGFTQTQKYFYHNDRGLIRVWSWETKEKIKEFKFDDGIVDIDFTFDDKYIIASTFNGNVYIANFETLEVLLTFTQPEFIEPKFNGFGTDFLVRFHPQLKYFAVSGDDGKVFIYDFQEVLASQSQVKEWKDYE